MHRKILFRNKVASGVLFLLGIWATLLTIQAFNLSLITHGSILILISLLFFISTILIFVPKTKALKTIKLVYLIFSACMIGVCILTGYEIIMTIASNPPITAFIIFSVLSAFFISFVISLDIQEKRQKLHIAELKESQKSDKPQRIGSLITVGIVILLGIGYFIIGKQAQQPPEIISDSYFEATRLDPNLSDEENGYVQFGETFGTTRTDSEIQQQIDEKYPYKERDKFRFSEENGKRTDYEQTRDENGEWTHKEKTFDEIVEKYPIIIDDLKTLEQSDFFIQLEKISEMQRQDNEMFLPTIQSLQGVIRSLMNISIYYTEQGNYEKATKLNILQLKLADKYLTNHGSLVQELIAIVCMNISHDTTQQMLKYDIPSELKQELLEMYNTTLTIDKDTLRKNTFIAEYHMLSNLTDNFNLTAYSMGEDVIGYLPFTEPFYNRNDIIQRLKYGLWLAAEGADALMDENGTPVDIKNQSWNIYNIFGDALIESLMPRLRGAQTIAEKMNQTHQEIIELLQQ